MLKNYINIALRSLKRNKLHAFINITGLAVGMTCCILILLFVQYELSYDKHNRRADRIYRIVTDLQANDWAISAFPLGHLLQENFAEVETFARIRPIEAFVQNTSNFVKNKERVFYADSSVFDVLDIKLLKGNPETALANVNSMVITPARAQTYFGNEDPIGKTLRLLTDQTDYVITGIFEPLPSASHVHMEVMVSSDNLEPMRPGSPNGWNFLTGHYTYVVMPEGVDHVAFGKRISTFLDEYFELEPGQPNNVIHLQPLTSIHLTSNRGYEIEANGNVNTVYTFMAIAFFILVIACINFMNLTTAQSLKRAKEVGMRKVVGSKKFQLIFQFMSESVMISFIALIIAIVLLAVSLPHFNSFSGKNIVINPLQNGMVVAIFLGITVLVGLISGIYPAFFLSAFKPVSVLKGNFISNAKGQGLRKGLVVFQFAVAFVIMVGTYIVYEQLHFMRSKDMGFDRDQVVTLKMPQDSLGVHTIKEEFKNIAGVESAALMLEVPGKMVTTTSVWYEGVREDIPENVYAFSGDSELTETLGMRLKSGRYFHQESQQFFREFVINETAMKKFGWTPETAIGKKMTLGGRNDENMGEVIGVVADFHYKHLQDAIGPLVMYQQPEYEGRIMGLKLSSGADLQGTLAAIEAKWKSLIPQHAFEYQFLDDSFEMLFDQEKKLGSLFGLFSMLAIFISCLGLFGLASFTMEQKRKSVAVRKVLGASVPGILMMMSADFLKLVVFGMLVAAPLAWWAMDTWLSGFAYHINFAWIVFLYAAIAGVTVAFLTVSYHSLKAAVANPVDALKEL